MVSLVSGRYAPTIAIRQAYVTLKCNLPSRRVEYIQHHGMHKNKWDVSVIWEGEGLIAHYSNALLVPTLWKVLVTNQDVIAQVEGFVTIHKVFATVSWAITVPNANIRQFWVKNNNKNKLNNCDLGEEDSCTIHLSIFLCSFLCCTISSKREWYRAYYTHYSVFLLQTQLRWYH